MKDEKKVSETYDSDISRAAVGRLFENFVNETDELTKDLIDDIELIDSFTEDDSEEAHKKRPFAQDKEYMDYINSMARSERNAKSPTLEQPNSVKNTMKMQKVTQAKYANIDKEDSIDNVNEEYEEEYADIEDERYEKRFSPNIRLVFVGGLFIVLIVMSFFVLKINSVTKALAVANEEIKSLQKYQLDYNTLAIETEDLRSELANIKKADEEKTSEQTQTVETTEAQTNEIATTAENSTPSVIATTNTPTQAIVDGKYKVVAGDNLWKIAEKIYGDGARSEEIKKANNITDESRIQIGSELIIP